MKFPDIHTLRWFESNGVHIALQASAMHSLQDSEVLAESGEPVQDLLDAVLLADHDPLLQCLDVWLENNFEWKPARHSTTPPPAEKLNPTDINAEAEPDHIESQALDCENLPQITMALFSVEGLQQIVYLTFPAAQIDQLAALPEQWLSLTNLRSYVSRCEIVLQALSLNKQARDKLQPGGMVLMENAFSDVWKVTLHIENVESKQIDYVEAQLNVQERCISLSEQPVQQLQREATDDYLVEIRLQNTLLINELETVSVWRTGRPQSFDLGDSIHGIPVKVICYDHHSLQASALYGSVLALGAGFGVLLDVNVSSRKEAATEESAHSTKDSVGFQEPSEGLVDDGSLSENKRGLEAQEKSSAEQTSVRISEELSDALPESSTVYADVLVSSSIHFSQSSSLPGECDIPHEGTIKRDEAAGGTMKTPVSFQEIPVSFQDKNQP